MHRSKIVAKHPDFDDFSVAIFDLDGTLVHSEHAWEEAKINILHQYGVTPSKSLLEAHCGRGLNGFLDEAFEFTLDAEARERIANQIGARADVLLPEMREPVAGAAELLCELHKRGLRIGICSSSPRRHILSAIEALGVARRVEAIVSGAELPRGKPDPLPYATIIQKMDCGVETACAFEDSAAGVQSASDAGLSVLAIGPGCQSARFSHCYFQAESFEGLLTFDDASLETTKNDKAFAGQ